MSVYQLISEPVFPNPSEADDDGLIAIGGDLSPQRLLNAYANGIFPWFSDGDPILWWSPNPRIVLFPEEFKASKSLKRIIKNNIFEIRTDTCFSQVVKKCATVPRKEQDGTWITKDMLQAYMRLHQLGYAHSFETFKDGQLVGGLYGVSIGKAFFGESMFSEVSNASKVAFAAMVDFCLKHDFLFIDAQVETEHLKSLGASVVQRDVFLELLNTALKNPTIKGVWK